MKKLIYVYVLCFAVFAAFSCGNRKKGEVNSIKFKKYEMDSTYHLFGDVKKPAIKIHLSMHYPVEYSNGQVLDSLQRLVITSVTTKAGQASRNPEEAMRKFIDRQTEEYRLLEKEYEKEQSTQLIEYGETSAAFSNQYTGKEDNAFNKDGILCFSNNVYRFMGGAHGLDGLVKKHNPRINLEEPGKTMQNLWTEI